MKKIYAFLTAALMSVSVFAAKYQVPSDAVLSDYYEQGNVCVCFYVPSEIDCNNIVVTGSFNEWSHTIANCVAVEPVEGYGGWYVGSFTPEAEPFIEKGIQAKPIMLDVDGNFSWEYQVGAATAIRGGVQVVQGSYAGEIELINYGTDAPNVFTVDAWKQNPCTAPAEPVEINVKLPALNCPASVEVIGDFDEWAGTAMAFENTGYFYAFFEAKPSQVFKFRSADSWDQELEIYREASDEWSTIAYNELVFSHFWMDGSCYGDPCKTIILDLSDPAKYRWTRSYYILNINCDDTKGIVIGSGQYKYGNQVTFSATPNYGYHFAQWNDSVTDNPRTFVMTQDTAFTAEFAKNAYSVATETSNAEWGTTAGDTSVLYLDTIVLTATPKNGYHFARWNDNNTTNPRRVVVTRDKTYQAIFAKNQYNIQKIAPNGTISGPTKANYLDSVSLTAQPNYGFHFVQWSDSVTDNPRMFLLTQDTAFTAEFAKNSYTVTTESSNVEWGTTAGDTSVLYLDIIVLNATSKYGYHFARWNDGNMSNPRQVTVTQDIAYRAIFEKNQYNIQMNAQNGTISGPTNANYLDSVSLTAQPNYGYHFVQWSDSVTDNPRYFILTQDTIFTAEFAFDTVGTCGKDYTLSWAYDEVAKTLVISGNGSFDENMRYGVQAKSNMRQLIIEEGVNIIGESAFAGCDALTTVSLPTSLKRIGDNAFLNCLDLNAIYNHRATPCIISTNTFDGINIFDCTLYVPTGSVAMYKHEASNWHVFYNIDTFGNDTISLYTVNYLDKDSIILGNDIVKLHFPEAPQIEGFTFMGWRPVPAVIVDGIAIQAVYQSNTQGNMPAEVTNPANPVQKLIRNGNVYILTDDKTYTLTGQEIK